MSSPSAKVEVKWSSSSSKGSSPSKLPSSMGAARTLSQSDVDPQTEKSLDVTEKDGEVSPMGIGMGVVNVAPVSGLGGEEPSLEKAESALEESLKCRPLLGNSNSTSFLTTGLSRSCIALMEILSLGLKTIDALELQNRRGVNGVAPMRGSGVLCPGMEAGTCDRSVP